MADGFLSGLVRRAGDWRDEAAERAEPRLRKGYRRARHEGGDALDELRRLWSQIEEVVERRVAPAAGRGARRAGEAASDYARSAGEAVSDYAGRAGRLAADYGPQARDAALHAADYLRGAARARPLLAIGIAVAATWVVAGMLRSDRRR